MPTVQANHLPHSSEQRTVTLLLQRLHRLLRQRDAGLLKRLEACIQVYEGEFEAERGGECFEDASSAGNDFTANAVAAYEAC